VSNNNSTTSARQSGNAGESRVVVGFSRGVYHLRSDGRDTTSASKRDDLRFPNTPMEVSRIMSQVNTMKIRDPEKNNNLPGAAAGGGGGTRASKAAGKKTKMASELVCYERRWNVGSRTTDYRYVSRTGPISCFASTNS
jgi:hypothetical protein